MMTTIKIENPSVGTNTVRPDGVDKVTGRAIYGADVRLPNMTYGRVKRSPHAHALIKSIDILLFKISRVSDSLDAAK